jgi:hypothetical protein
MDMRMLRVVVNYADPFQLGTSVVLDSLQHIAGQPLEVYAVAELGRENQLPEALVPGLLPFAEEAGHVDALFFRIEARRILFVFDGRTLTHDIAAMCTPLPRRGVCGIGDSHRTALESGADGISRSPALRPMKSYSGRNRPIGIQ